MGLTAVAAVATWFIVYYTAQNANPALVATVAVATNLMWAVVGSFCPYNRVISFIIKLN